jgi:hypothetical protein
MIEYEQETILPVYGATPCDDQRGGPSGLIPVWLDAAGAR